jgi:hypothetical protein
MTKEDIQDSIYHLARAFSPEEGKGMRKFQLTQAWYCFECILYGHGMRSKDDIEVMNSMSLSDLEKEWEEEKKRLGWTD